MNTQKNNTASKQDEHTGADAYRSLIDRLETISENGLAPYTIDATYAVSVLLTATKKCAELQTELSRLPINHDEVRKLETYALAFQHVNTLLIAQAPQPSSFDEDLTSARTLRTALFSSAESLAFRNKVSWSVLEKIRPGTGHVDLIEDLAALAEVLQPFSGTIVDAAELQQASKLVQQLTKTLLHREDSSATQLLRSHRRKLAALLVDAYDELQAAVSFLRRREKDASSFTPSLYVPRKNQSKKSEEVEPAPTPAPKEAPKNNAVALVEEPSDNPFEQN